jgi:hypothetical protein
MPEATHPYAPPDSEVLIPEPGEDGPLPWEDPVGYPSLGRRLRRTVVCYIKRPVWFFHRIAQGPPSLAKPFQYHLFLSWPVFLFGVLVLGVGAIKLLSTIRSFPGVWFGPEVIETMNKFLVVGLFPLWYFGVLLAWSLALHGALRMLADQPIRPMVYTGRAIAYCVPILLPMALANLKFHGASLYVPASAIPLVLLLVPGLARMHGISKLRSGIAVCLGLGLVTPLTWYAHAGLLENMLAALVELKGWAR